MPAAGSGAAAAAALTDGAAPRATATAACGAADGAGSSSPRAACAASAAKRPAAATARASPPLRSSLRRLAELGEALSEQPPRCAAWRQRRRIAQRDEGHARVALRVRRAGGQPRGAFAERRHRLHQSNGEVDRERLLRARAAHHVGVRQQPQHQSVARVGQVHGRNRIRVLEPHAPLGPRRPPQHRVGGGRQGRYETGVLRDEGPELGAYAEKLLVVRAGRIPRRTLALHHDRIERRQRSLQADDAVRSRQVHLVARQLQSRVAPERLRLAVAPHQRAQTLAESCIESADGIVVPRQRGEARSAAAAHVVALVSEPGTVRFARAVRALEIHEVLQGLGIEWCELDHHARRQVARVEGKVGAADARTRPERRSDVPHGREVSHLLDRDRQQHLPPALDGRGFLRRQSVALAVLQAEGGVQIGTHEVVLELCRFAERADEVLALRGRSIRAAIVHMASGPEHLCCTKLRRAALPNQLACSRVSRKLTSGQRSRVSSRLTREGAR